MAKRELSGTLKNLKFMQRAAQKEQKLKKEEEEEEVVYDSNFPSSTVPKKCVVIMEGDPHPGAIKGRMSFLSFNPSIDKLNEESSGFHQREASATCSGSQSEITANRENVNPPDVPDNLEPSICSNGDYKRKQADEVSQAHYPNKSQKNVQDQKSSGSNSRSSQKQSKREKLDWNVLRPPKHQNKRH